jgi:hypothetical protein
LTDDGETKQPPTEAELVVRVGELLLEIAEKDIMIGHLEVQNSDLAGYVRGNTCMMCNLWERADCFDQKTALEKDKAELEEEIKSLGNAAYAIFKAPFPLHDYCTKEQWEFACHFVEALEKND